jgi:hypothetical protein
MRTRTAVLFFLLIALVGLAGQAAAATFTVTNTDDSGPGSLRQAIVDANANPGSVIAFSIGSGPQVIKLLTGLPPISRTFLDGATQPGYAGEPIIRIDGALFQVSEPCLIAQSTGDIPTLVRALVITGCPNAGIILAANSRLLGSWVGIGFDGVTARPNDYGVFVGGNSFVGGFGPADGNVISGNRLAGVAFFGIGGVFGNRIGTDKTGLIAVPNPIGVEVGGLPGVVGDPLAGNLISGNTFAGISVGPNVKILGNRIGSDVNGEATLPPQLHGIRNCCGTDVIIRENEVVGNTTGITVEMFAERIALQRNVLRENGFGIDLGPIVGSTPNDASDADDGPNLQQNYPVLSGAWASPDSLVVQGTLHSTPEQFFTIELFASPAGTPGAAAHRYLGSLRVRPDPGPDAPFLEAFSVVVAAGEVLTATATDEAGNTSELSAPIAVVASPVTVSGIAPDSGDAAGGESVDVTGTAFQTGATAMFGTVPAAATTVVGATAITATTPALPAGTLHPVLVENPDESIGGLAKAWFANFLDVPAPHPLQPFVESLVRAAVTSGCGGGNYCPDQSVTRAQMSVFLLRSKESPEYEPPPASGFVFNDVRANAFAAAWIEELSRRQVTAGCGGGNYCPDDLVTREQMSVFLLRTLEGSSYSPPACVTPTFADVPCASPFAAWIEEIARRGITAGCGGGNFCPGFPISRGEMAVFLVETFSL